MGGLTQGHIFLPRDALLPPITNWDLPVCEDLTVAPLLVGRDEFLQRLEKLREPTVLPGDSGRESQVRFEISGL